MVRFETLPGIAEDRVAAAIRAVCAAIFPSEVRVEVLASRFGDDGGATKLRFVMQGFRLRRAPTDARVEQG